MRRSVSLGVQAAARGYPAAESPLWPAQPSITVGLIPARDPGKQLSSSQFPVASIAKNSDNSRHVSRRTAPQNPETAEEWQEAVNGAQFYLGVDSCRQYGLLKGGPQINVGRCIQILRRGRRKGYLPAPFEELVRMYVNSEGDEIEQRAPVP
jgi:hypothetical protein